jgi:SagB-type dehydrogenase family enzyme
VDDGTTARDYHSLTRHGAPVDRSQLVAFQPLDPANRPRPFTTYIDRGSVPLPRELSPVAGDGFDARVLARLLFLTAGVTRVSSGPAFDEPTYFRTAMSAGNLHPVEVYVVAGDDAGIDAGVHHFAPLDFALVPLRAGDLRGALAAATADERFASAPVSFVFTGIPWRTAWKYGERGYRHLWWDAGTMIANLLAAAAAVSIPAEVALGFVDAQVARLVATETAAEFPLAVVALGAPHSEAPPPRELEPLAIPTAPLSRSPIEFPLITRVHAAGALADAGEVRTWRAQMQRVPVAITPEPASLTAATARSIDDVILQRGSTRLMRRDTAPRELLLWALDAARVPVPSDVAPNGTLLEHDVSVHAVDGVPGGLYRLVADELVPVRRGDARELAARLCLDQPLGGDSAYTVFHSASLGRVLEAGGSRAYRAAQFEAGVVSGRLSLAAFALGFGATGLTFYDDFVARVFETDALPMLATAVGVPDYRNTAGGRPGHATELSGYARLMQRLSAQLRAR